ncbi:hypothetical protein PV02_09995 [Methanolobus chelungpuianus]|uniref:Uncharacterized protein n=1 Tax=Methanolobus chelungpuianus TaxID=502115 RepID=A0AAE3HB30_9EURY|nr:hypothetical protein [Methanolobus chelungpuianus]
MTGRSGPVLETDETYDPSCGTSPNGPVTARHVRDISILPGFNAPINPTNGCSPITVASRWPSTTARPVSIR